MIQETLPILANAMLPEHHRTLEQLLASGAAVRRAGDDRPIPIGGAEFQRAPYGWDLVWVELWPKNEYATHWQPFSRLRVDANGTFILSDDTGKVRTSIQPLDSTALRDCGWDRWNSANDEAENGRYFVQDMLRLARRITGADDFAN
jgi:hypothetical protein